MKENLVKALIAIAAVAIGGIIIFFIVRGKLFVPAAPPPAAEVPTVTDEVWELDTIVTGLGGEEIPTATVSLSTEEIMPEEKEEEVVEKPRRGQHIRPQ